MYENTQNSKIEDARVRSVLTADFLLTQYDTRNVVSEFWYKFLTIFHFTQNSLWRPHIFPALSIPVMDGMTGLGYDVTFSRGLENHTSSLFSLPPQRARGAAFRKDCRPDSRPCS